MIATPLADLKTRKYLDSLLNESLLMKRLNHPNIVGLLGVCFDTPKGYDKGQREHQRLLEEQMCPFHQHCHSPTRKLNTLSPHLSVLAKFVCVPGPANHMHLLKMCLDVAKGMSYLAENHLVHRDLAARN